LALRTTAVLAVVALVIGAIVDGVPGAFVGFVRYGLSVFVPLVVLGYIAAYKFARERREGEERELVWFVFRSSDRDQLELRAWPHRRHVIAP